MNGLGEILLSLFEKPEGNSKDNPENGQWILVKDKENKNKSNLFCISLALDKFSYLCMRFACEPAHARPLMRASWLSLTRSLGRK